MSARRTILDQRLAHTGSVRSVARLTIFFGTPIEPDDHAFLHDHLGELEFDDLATWLAHEWPGETADKRDVESPWDALRTTIAEIAAKRFPHGAKAQANVLWHEVAPMASCFRKRDWDDLFVRLRLRINDDDEEAIAMLGCCHRNRAPSRINASASPPAQPPTPPAKSVSPVADLAKEVDGLSRLERGGQWLLFWWRFEYLAAAGVSTGVLRGFALDVLDRVPAFEFVMLSEWLFRRGEPRRDLLPKALERLVATGLPNLADLISDLLNTRSAWEEYGFGVFRRLLSANCDAVLWVLLRAPKVIAAAELSAPGRFACAVRISFAKALIALAEDAIDNGDEERAKCIGDAIATVELPRRIIREVRQLAKRRGAPPDLVEVIGACVSLHSSNAGETETISDLAHALLVFADASGLRAARVSLA